MLYDLEQMHQLNKGIQTDEAFEIAGAFVAKQFYFELERPLFNLHGWYRCNGFIRTRFSGGREIKLLNYVSQKRGGFAIGDKDIVIPETPYPMRNGVYLQRLKFDINDMDDQFVISLTDIRMTTRPIVGFASIAKDLTAHLTAVRNADDNGKGTPVPRGHG